METDGLVDWFEGLPRHGWRQCAACKGQDFQMFFRQFPKKALTFCRICPVADDCLVYALRTELDHENARAGVYGGLPPRDRHRFAKSVKAAGVTIGDAYRVDMRFAE